jgi:hypothetical protein
MNRYKVTIKRLEKFYDDVIVDATTEAEARENADLLMSEGKYNFDYSKESRIVDEYIVEVKKLKTLPQNV